MKPARPSPAWKILAVLSLAANVVLLGWALRPAHRAPAAPAPAPETPPAARAPATAAIPATVPQPLAPYAALGSFLAENNHIADLQWTPDQFAAFVTGLREVYEGRGFAMDEEATKLREDINRRVQQLLSAQQPDPLEDYFRTLRDKEGVLRTPSGLHYRIIDPGYGDAPGPNSTVVVSFTGRLPGGEAVPSLTRTRIRVKLADLLPGLREGLPLLKIGGKALLYLPPALSFSEKEWPADVPPRAPIIVFVELHDVQK